MRENIPVPKLVQLPRVPVPFSVPTVDLRYATLLNFMGCEWEFAQKKLVIRISSAKISVFIHPPCWAENVGLLTY